MDPLNFVNLIQSALVATGILGGLLLWLTKTKEFKGIAFLLFTIALGSCINILEETGLTKEIYLISPVFIMLFGPMTYLAAKLLIDKELNKVQWWHLSPVIPLLFFTSYTYFVIGIGTIWRFAYAFLTITLLLKYKRTMDEERSDSEDFSLNWLVWVLAVTTMFNLFDLIRLNVQQIIPYELNVLGQGINNAIWLVVVMIITIKLQSQQKIPKITKKPTAPDTIKHSTKNDYGSLFEELDKLITLNQWFLKPRLTLSDLSVLTGLQTRDISRAINVITEKSFNEYINNYRVNYVFTTIEKNTEKTLSDIAADAGFSSKASFNKVFKEVSGMTPTEYRSRKEV